MLQVNLREKAALGKYKKETYKKKFHFNIHPPLALESILNVKLTQQY